VPIHDEADLVDRVRAGLRDGGTPIRVAAPARSAPAGPPAVRRPLDGVLSARQAVRSYRPDPVPGDDLAALLRSARSADAAAWSAAGPPGWAPAARFVTADDPPDLRSTLFRQYAAAPAILLVGGDVAAAVDAMGLAGYRHALLRASGFGYAAWLAAVALGLDGCVFGRASARANAAVREWFGGTHRHLFTVTIGAAR